MVLRIDIYRGSYRASFYSPFWIINSTDLKFEFKIENDKTFVDVVDQPYFICPKKFDSESHKKKVYFFLFFFFLFTSISRCRVIFDYLVLNKMKIFLNGLKVFH